MHSLGIWDLKTQMASEALAAAKPLGISEETSQLHWALSPQVPEGSQLYLPGFKANDYNQYNFLHMSEFLSFSLWSVGQAKDP